MQHEHKPGFTYSGDELEGMQDMPFYQAAILHEFKPYLRGNVLEVGAGLGAFSRLIQPMCQHLTLVEPDAQNAAFLAQTMGDKAGVRVQQTAIETLLNATPEAPYDAVVMINLLEHLAQDGEVLSRLRQQMTPTGALLIFVPALPALYSAMDRKLGHVCRYGRRQLSEVVTGAGFQVNRVRWFDLVGMVPWYLLYTLKGSRVMDARMSKIYDRWVMSWQGPLERWLPPPVGKNLVLVATPLHNNHAERGIKG
ncbi:Methyltransferase type 12 [Magnetococcus marinus MC-1]|uniref:Methyltransferase type 12 n=1 Tax=Magnetococcus marinus (strain ATCC BAA-1437 / JCM 17883 / MC-1) TaxID=156889 RepID=A0L7J5_MAGMM|nr:class I SAM-dependent methyltransferase [Magnetococcus marinus]ABK43938.1 Methyltransferase type 12 [Magnetococcus marinus MC-1]